MLKRYLILLLLPVLMACTALDAAPPPTPTLDPALPTFTPPTALPATSAPTELIPSPEPTLPPAPGTTTFPNADGYTW